MIITFHTKKGGTGKSSSILSLCSVLAEVNAARETPYRFCVVDADETVGTCRRFDHARRKIGLPDHGITFRHMPPTAASQRTLAALRDDHQLVLVDMPGAFDAEATAFALEADLIVVPTALGVDEVGRAIEVADTFGDLVGKGGLATRIALLITRCAPTFQFETASAKQLYQHLRSSGLPVLQDVLPLEPAVRESCDGGLYLFELKQQAGRSKSAERAHANAEHVLDACIHHKIMKPAPSGGAQ